MSTTTKADGSKFVQGKNVFQGIAYTPEVLLLSEYFENPYCCSEMASNVKNLTNEDMDVLLLSELLENPHCCSEMASNVKKQPSEDMDVAVPSLASLNLNEDSTYDEAHYERICKFLGFDFRELTSVCDYDKPVEVPPPSIDELSSDDEYEEI